jgi:hypothetical protein
MKNISRIFAFVYLLTCMPFLLQAQKSKEEYDQKVAAKLATMDLSGVKNGFLLNKGVFSANEIADYRKLPRTPKGDIAQTTTAEEWRNLYQRLITADLRDKEKLPALAIFTETDHKKKAQNNSIDIGTSKNEIRAVSIDFQDGKGFRGYKMAK